MVCVMSRDGVGEECHEMVFVLCMMVMTEVMMVVVVVMAGLVNTVLELYGGSEVTVTMPRW